MEIYIENVGQYNESYIVEVIETYFRLGKVDSIYCKDVYINNMQLRGATIVLREVFHNENTHIMKREIRYHNPFRLRLKDLKESWIVYTTVDDCKFHLKCQNNKKYKSIHKYDYDSEKNNVIV